MTARAQDVGIGLAVAWARYRGLNVRAMKCEVSGCEAPGCRICGLAVQRHGLTHRSINRGPVVEPEPLRDHRVAFGIALAQRGPWVRDTYAGWIEPGGDFYVLGKTQVLISATIRGLFGIDLYPMRIRP